MIAIRLDVTALREIVLDTETTGLDPKSGDRIVEIGCVELINHIPSGDRYHVYINPERSMPEAAFRVHGISDTFLADKPVFRDISGEFLSFVRDATLVIHNASFDMGFLNAELATLSLDPIPMHRAVDTLDLARRRHPGAQNSLDALCARYGIDTSHRELHGALLDAQLLARVYIELLGGKQSSLTFSTVKTDINGGAGARRAKRRKREQPLSSRLTEADIDRHRAFVKTLSDTPVWKEYDPDSTG